MRVRDGSAPVVQLNELEFVRGEVYANVWHANRIARIDPESGQVLGWIDLAGLLAPGEVSDPEAVLNGIAYDEMRIACSSPASTGRAFRDRGRDRLMTTCGSRLTAWGHCQLVEGSALLPCEIDATDRSQQAHVTASHSTNARVRSRR